jgi:hypothetical protein
LRRHVSSCGRRDRPRAVDRRMSNARAWRQPIRAPTRSG